MSNEFFMVFFLLEILLLCSAQGYKLLTGLLYAYFFKRIYKMIIHSTTLQSLFFFFLMIIRYEIISYIFWVLLLMIWTRRNLNRGPQSMIYVLKVSMN